MIEDRSADIAALKERVVHVANYLHIDEKRAELAKLEERAAEPGFWDDQNAAQAIMSKTADIRGDIEDYDAASTKVDDLEVAMELALDDQDEGLSSEVDHGIEDLASAIDSLELASWFSGEFDGSDAIVTITPGAGGLEAQDWTDMLFHMYLRYAEKKGWKVDINDAPQGEVIGIDRATFTVSGKNAYGMLSSEQGVHRLVRISPTDDKKRRQTTFAGVEVLPVLPEEIEVDIDPSDLRIDVYRSSGPGGQSVNTTDSAVRITHVPTNTVVTCQNEKSQIQNREACMRILKSRLYELEEAKRAAELDELRGPKKDISFGSQIRNYVLYPYQMVKDLRTEEETGNVDAVLGGDLDRFVIAYHRWNTARRSAR